MWTVLKGNQSNITRGDTRDMHSTARVVQLLLDAVALLQKKKKKRRRRGREVHKGTLDMPTHHRQHT
jgi:hypothetical protein